MFFLGHYREREFLFGPNGMADWFTYVRQVQGQSALLNLYSLSPTSQWSEFLYWLSVAFSLTFMFGVLPRISTIALFALVSSAFNRNWLVLDGGNNILALVLCYLCFADLRYGAAWAPDVLRRLTSRLAHRAPMQRLYQVGDHVRVVLHNGAMFAILAQICILYFWSGFYKVTGDVWQHGTALYFILRTDEFSIPPLSGMIYQSATLVTLLTYSTLLFQMAFPFLMWNRLLKPFLFVIAAAFHVGIAVMMGLVLFSATMIVMDIALFDDSAIDRAGTVLAGVARNIGSLLTWRSRHDVDVLPGK
jgi:hypothetical protein